MRLALAVVLAVSCLAGAADAQLTPMIGSAMRQGWRPGCGDNSEAICVTVNFSMSAPEPAIATGGDWTSRVAKANASLFDLINRECDVLKASFKGDCSLSQLNVSTNVRDQQEGSAHQMINVGANATM